MIEIEITTEMKEKAYKKTLEMPDLKNSVTKNDGVYAGFLGEEVAKVVMGGVEKNTYDYDLVLEDGKTVDVKSKRTSVKPQPHYECSVFAFNTKQKCDYYAFVRVNEKTDKAWFLGVYKKEDYYKDARLVKKGDIDPSNNLVFKADCYNMPISLLKEAL